MNVKKLFEQYTPEEIANAFVLPVKLTAKQWEEAAKQLAEHREKHRAEIAEAGKRNVK